VKDEALPGARYWGRSADALTAVRAVLAVPLALAAHAGNWSVAAVLLAVAWWSDFFDGRLARRSSESTALGDWDLAADTTVGAGLLIGLVLGHHVPPSWGVGGAVLGVGFLALRNPALGMLLQAAAYGPALFFAARSASPSFWLAAATIGAIAILDRRRLFGYVLPVFFGGILGRSRKPG